MYSKRQTTLKACIFFKLAVILYYLIVTFKLSDISQLERFAQHTTVNLSLMPVITVFHCVAMYVTSLVL